MYNRHKILIIACGAAALGALLWLTVIASAAQQIPDTGQFPSHRPARMADGHPDLNGMWAGARDG